MHAHLYCQCNIYNICNVKCLSLSLLTGQGTAQCGVAQRVCFGMSVDYRSNPYRSCLIRRHIMKIPFQHMAGARLRWLICSITKNLHFGFGPFCRVPLPPWKMCNDCLMLFNKSHWSIGLNSFILSMWNAVITFPCKPGQMGCDPERWSFWLKSSPCYFHCMSKSCGALQVEPTGLSCHSRDR